MTPLQDFTQSFLYEIDKTRQVFATLPEDRMDWQPHAKSMTLSTLVGHMAEIPGWVQPTMMLAELDLATMDYTPFAPTTRAQALDRLNRDTEVAEATLKAFDESKLYEPWTMRHGEQVMFTLPRYAVMRDSLLHHLIHHRGQLSVYLRQLDVPLSTQLFGPTADTMAPAA